MGAFKKMVKKLEDKGESEKEAKGVAAIAGRKKYGKEGMERKAEAGRERAKRK